MIHQVSNIEEGMQKLFQVGQRPPVSFKYEFASQAEILDYLYINEDKIPVLKWRYYPKHYTLLKEEAQLGELSTLKSLNFSPNTVTMAQLLCRELDLAEFFLHSEVQSIMGYGSEQAANFIVRMKNGTIMNLEASVTMPADARRESKHTIFTTNGMITDLAADKVIVQEQVHLFNSGKDPISFTDHDVNLFGLTMDEQDICYACYALIDGREEAEEWKRQGEHLRSLVEGALLSLKTGCKFIAD